MALLLLLRGTWRHAFRWELGLVVLLVALCSLPSLGMFRWSFRWLPLAHLALALLAAKIWLRQDSERKHAEPFEWSRNPGILAMLGIFGTYLLTRATPIFDAKLAWAYGTLATIWAVWEDRARRTARRSDFFAPILVLSVLLSGYVLLPTRLAVPSWKLPDTLLQPAPLDRGIRYFAAASQADYFPGGFSTPGFGPHMRPGFSAMLSGVEFINGYSAMAPKGPTAAFMQGVHGYLDEPTLQRVWRDDIKPGGLLDRLGVHGLLLGSSQKSTAKDLERWGWRLISEGPEGMVLHREGPHASTPQCIIHIRFVEFEAGPAWSQALRALDGWPAVAASEAHPPGSSAQFGIRHVELSEKRRHRLILNVESGAQPALIAVMRAWVPGWHAELAGQTLEIFALDGLNTAIKIPAGLGGTVTLTYRPWGIAWGLKLMVLSGLVGCLLILLLRRRSRATHAG